jgi:hypothetical protein
MFCLGLAGGQGKEGKACGKEGKEWAHEISSERWGNGMMCNVFEWSQYANPTSKVV